MFVGHFAVALGAKRVAPRIPLSLLVAAAIGLDLIWPLLLLAGQGRSSLTPPHFPRATLPAAGRSGC